MQKTSYDEFKSFEYQRSKQVFASEDIKSDILTVGIRRVERDSGVSHHTLDKVLKGQRVRRKTLAKILKRLPLYRETGKAELGQL